MNDETVRERARGTTGPASPVLGVAEPVDVAVPAAGPQGEETEVSATGATAAQPSAALEKPRLADGVEVVGAINGSGFTEQQWLITRGGQFMHVSELLYRVAERADGTRSCEEIAAGVTDVMPYAVTAEHIRRILDTKLAPLGLLPVGADDDATGAQRSTSSGPLRVAGRIVTIGPRFLEPATGVLQHLFRPWIAAPLLLAIVAVHGWVYLGQGMGSAIVGLIQQPLLIVPLFAIIVLAGVFHELGHAAALRYGGGRCRNMGFGFYLIYPALFTDTSDAYRLGRRARIRTDLGGFYFHQIFALVLVALSLVTGQAIWLLAVLVIDLEMLRQLLFPFVRFDGYWLLADLTGIPDLYTHFGAVARRRLSGQGDVPTLRPWPRRVFTVYAAVAVPVLAGLLVLFVTRAPAYLGLMWTSGQRQMQIAGAALANGDPLGIVLPVLQTLLLALPLVGGTYLLFNLARLVRPVARAMVSARASARAGEAGP